MPYINRAYYEARFGERELIELTDRADEALGVVDDGVFTAAEADASSLIDGYLRSRYTVPMVSPTGDVKFHAGSIVRYVLHRDGKPQEVESAYERAIAWLKDVAAGRVTLPADVASASTERGAVGQTFFNESTNDFAESY